ncbi:hypothetical protein [Rothia sp. P5766]|uniref:hypothetical protein n=1 Tax=Rothia sp. P5766 TaxID=3402656 RepID=UPI003AEA8D7F
MKEKDSKISRILLVLTVLGFIVGGGMYLVNSTVQGEVKLCTVSSARHIQDFNAGAPTASVEVQTSDCGKIVITRLKCPGGVNMARLAEVLNAHQGERFEFVFKFIQLGGGSAGSYGVRSLEPVR